MEKVIVFLLLLVSTGLFATEPAQITYMTEDYPPENYLEGGQLKGYAVDVLKAVWKQMGVAEQPIQVLPWSRAYEALKAKSNTMLFAMARTPDREALFQWVGPIFRAQFSLFELASKPPQKKDLAAVRDRGARIGVLRNDIGSDLLIDAGFSRDSLQDANTLDQLLSMLKAGRVDYVCTSENAIKELLSYRKDLSVDYRPSLLVDDVRVYYAFNRETDRALVERFQAALSAIETTRKDIIRRYNRTE